MITIYQPRKVEPDQKWDENHRPVPLGMGNRHLRETPEAYVNSIDQATRLAHNPEHSRADDWCYQNILYLKLQFEAHFPARYTSHFETVATHSRLSDHLPVYIMGDNRDRGVEGFIRN